MKQITLKVEGMSCGHCVHSIDKGFSEIVGIQSVNVDLAKKQVSVAYDENQVTIETIKDTILDLGYDILE